MSPLQKPQNTKPVDKSAKAQSTSTDSVKATKKAEPQSNSQTEQTTLPDGPLVAYSETTCGSVSSYTRNTVSQSAFQHNGKHGYSSVISHYGDNKAEGSGTQINGDVDKFASEKMIASIKENQKKNS